MTSPRRAALAIAFASFVVGTLPAAEHIVTVTDNPTERFDPQYLTIQVGDTVTWKNVAGTHNVVADDGSFTSGSPASAPWTFSQTFAATGSFGYRCTLHDNDGQVGRIDVRPPRSGNEIAVTINAWDMTFVGVTDIAEPDYQLFVRHGGAFQSSVRLPSGAQITGIEISACIDPAGPNLCRAVLFVCPEPTSPCTEIAKIVVPPGTKTPPYCRVWQTNLTDGPLVDNLNNTYGLIVESARNFRSVKVFYKKVLSPAPATATFSDVPTSDPAFRAVEALAASGVTQGCGSGQFCANATVTRAQMAIFLARALGLYWPN